MKRPARRSAAELRDALCVAARDLFASQGYNGTSTREIAKRAGAAEQLIYKHFHSKAALFGAAVLDPLEAAFDAGGQLAAESLSGFEDAQKSMASFVDRVLSIALAERKLLIGFLGVATFEPDEFPRDGRGPIQDLIERMREQEAIGRATSAATSLNVEDPMMETRLVIAFILSVVLLEDIIFDPAERDRARMRQSLVKLLVFGLAGRALAPVEDKAGEIVNRKPAVRRSLKQTRKS